MSDDVYEKTHEAIASRTVVVVFDDRSRADSFHRLLRTRRMSDDCTTSPGITRSARLGLMVAPHTGAFRR